MYIQKKNTFTLFCPFLARFHSLGFLSSDFFSTSSVAPVSVFTGGSSSSFRFFAADSTTIRNLKTKMYSCNHKSIWNSYSGLIAQIPSIVLLISNKFLKFFKDF